MPGDKNDLATNRLLEILRGHKKSSTEVEEIMPMEEVKVGLSSDEEKELLNTNARSEVLHTPAKKFSIQSIVDTYLINGSRKLLKKIIAEKQGFIGLDIGSHTIKNLYPMIILFSNINITRRIGGNT